MLFHKPKTYHMDHDAANAALQNILVSCGKTPNTVPISKLAIQPKSDCKTYNILLILTGLLLLFTLISPLLITPITKYMAKHYAPKPVVLVNDYVEDGILYMEFSGDNIMFEDAYMETNDNRNEKAVFFDKKTNTIAFNYYDNTESNIYIPLKGNGKLQFLITPDKE